MAMDPQWQAFLDIIIAFSTAAMVLVAGATAVFSRRVAEENRLLRELGELPEVMTYLELEGEHNDEVALVIHNSGRGIARDIQLAIKCDKENFVWHIDNITTNTKLNPITAIRPGGELRIQIGNLHNLIGVDGLMPFTTVLYYKNSKQEKCFTKTCELDVSQFAEYGIHHDRGYAIRRTIERYNKKSDDE
ncbi:hypothetical protein [Aquibaculum sediminis]|uniref:hypothetical protein n=1 Tax=Aquibaculum sediminis TaxID=3231907 RepID=UPI00345189D8